ncbi:hypothetical protein [Actinomadura rubrisoli]|uniref:Uncharacterized protein n=1 Tax=Actinomadura rubrisoli TaxID=2530368 RepID=A0A4R5CDL4_9ACTN|nr:hypothetical protein [Actinomadura rubrisoli]TDD98141.1 hypothetical protein E1298_00290 [Actinomadura rubrisoli]
MTKGLRVLGWAALTAGVAIGVRIAVRAGNARTARSRAAAAFTSPSHRDERAERGGGSLISMADRRARRAGRDPGERPGAPARRATRGISSMTHRNGGGPAGRR